MKTKYVEEPGLNTKEAIQKCKAIMQGKLLNMPFSVAQAIEDSKFRVEARDHARLSWALVDGWTEPKLEQGYWKKINDTHFINLGGSNRTKWKVKKWLIEHRFLGLQMETLPDGRVVPKKCPYKEAQRYRVPSELKVEDRMNVNLECKDKSIGVLFNNKTGDDLYCRITRDNLALLELQEDRLFEFCLNPPTKTVVNEQKQNESDRENRCFRAITSIARNCGNITTGTNVNRLYSPWAVAPTDVRPLFKFCGAEMVHFDLQASQPTLIADYCGDNLFLDACYSDELYTQVAELLGLDDGTLTAKEVRRLAKKRFLAYCYGNVRKPTARNKEALAVQGFVEETYPIAGHYIRNQKKGNYRTFNRKLQNREAAIFLKIIFFRIDQT